MADKIIDVEIRPNLNGIRSLSAEILKMRNELKTATDPKEVDRLNKALKQTEEQVKDINTATDKFDLGKKFDDVYKDTAPLSSRLGELEDRMYELAFSGKSASEEFAALQKEAVSMRQTIIGVDKQVDILADNKGFSVFGDGLGEVGASLARMDFDTASKQATTLSNNVSKMTFGKAIGSIKSLGSTIISLGKAILANPLFLLIGVITAIAVGIYKLLDSLGVIKVVFDAVGAAIGFVVDAIKDFLDWIGLTDFAGEESAEKAKKNAERRAEAEKLANQSIISSMDREIEVRRAMGENVVELEKQKIDKLIKLQSIEIQQKVRTLRALQRIGMSQTEGYNEQFKELQNLREGFKDLQRDRLLIDIEETNTQKDNQKERIENAKEYTQNRLNAERELEDLQSERMEEGVEKELHLNRLKYKRLIEDLKTNEDLTKEERQKFQQEYTHSLMSSNIEIVKANQEKNDKIKEDNEKKDQDSLKKLTEFYLKEDQLTIKLMAEGDDKKKAQRTFQFEQEIAQLNKESEEKLALMAENSALTEEQKQAEIERLNNIEKTMKQKLVDDLEQIDTDAKDKDKKREEELKDAKVAIAGSVLSSLSSLTDTFAGKSEASQRRAFNINKAIGIAQATMNTSQAVTKALAETTDPTPTQSLRIANAVAIGLAGVAQVASIAKQKFSPSGGGGGGGNVPTPSGAGAGGGGAQAQATPNLELFGQANGLNTFFQAQGQEQQTVQAVISLDQFSTSKDKQAQIFENSTL
ncbi:MAG: hypothetical protein K0U52_01575 [Gammaproteobacteria bacterium]|nr:hypothetical protein [Gammaproteobacteria bacterium]